MKRLPILACLCLAAAACGPSTVEPGGSPDMTVVTVDPDGDRDNDGFTPNAGDCDDGDGTRYPGAPEQCDGRDHNCNGTVDDTCDDDKDGYAVLGGGAYPGGDCDDVDPLVNPGAVEFVGNMVDDDCDGTKDEEATPCPSLAASDPKGFAAAMEICGSWLTSATINMDADARGRDVKADYGMYRPKKGVSFAVLSTGVAADATDPGFDVVKTVQPGTEFKNNNNNPLPQNNVGTCIGGPQQDEQIIHDMTELRLTLKVPTNAKSFSFQFAFLTAEYPEYVGTKFNDKFLVLLDSKAYKGNISFDMFSNPITVNTGFFDVCQSALICKGTKMNMCSQPTTELAGTGYDLTDTEEGGLLGGGTGWLTTTSPVSPGETATLRFIIFDEGDHIYDSAVMIDNFQWKVEPSTGPVTIP